MSMIFGFNQFFSDGVTIITNKRVKLHLANFTERLVELVVQPALLCCSSSRATFRFLLLVA